eukprot:13065-Heterococcus_DN1.PRE.3
MAIVSWTCAPCGEVDEMNNSVVDTTLTVVIKDVWMTDSHTSMLLRTTLSIRKLYPDSVKHTKYTEAHTHRHSTAATDKPFAIFTTPLMSWSICILSYCQQHSTSLYSSTVAVVHYMRARLVPLFGVASVVGASATPSMPQL